jgi:nucleoside-diphosphate-sugar epimerase
MQRVLVTGVAGFIGSRVAEMLLAQGSDVVGVDCFLENSYSASLKRKRLSQFANNPNFSFFNLDLRFDDLTVLPAEIDFIVNEAAMPGLIKSWSEFDTYLGCNVLGLQRLLHHAKELKLKKFVQVSTSSVYGKFATCDENGPKEPFSPYGVSKLAAENLAFSYLNNFDVPVSVLRYYSVFGPGQRPDMGYNIFIDAALSGKSIKIFGDGNQTRTNTYVDDIASGTILALSGAKVGEAYNLSGADSISVNDAIRFIESETGCRLNIDHVAPRPGDQLDTRGDYSKATDTFGYKPLIGTLQGLKAQIAWQTQLLEGKSF